MIWYILVALFLFWGTFVKKSKPYYFVAMIILFLFTAFRDVSLGDYYNETYIHIFSYCPPLSEFSGDMDYEKGFMFIMAVSRLFSMDFRLFQVIYTLIAILLLHLVIVKLQLDYNDRNLFLFTYFCMRFFINNFIILRQNLANLVVWFLVLSSLSIVVLVVGSIVASLFHITALASIPSMVAFPFLSRRNRKAIFWGTLGASVFLVFASDSFLNIMVNWMIDIAGERYRKYLITTEGVNAGFNWAYYFIRVGFFSFFYYFYDGIRYEKKGIIYVIAAYAVIFGSINVDIFSRFMEFFMIAIYAIMTLSYRWFPTQQRRLYLFFYVSALLIIMVRQLLIYGGGYCANYSLFFN